MSYEPLLCIWFGFTLAVSAVRGAFAVRSVWGIPVLVTFMVVFWPLSLAVMMERAFAPEKS